MEMEGDNEGEEQVADDFPWFQLFNPSSDGEYEDERRDERRERRQQPQTRPPVAEVSPNILDSIQSNKQKAMQQIFAQSLQKLHSSSGNKKAKRQKRSHLLSNNDDGDEEQVEDEVEDDSEDPVFQPPSRQDLVQEERTERRDVHFMQGDVVSSDEESSDQSSDESGDGDESEDESDEDEDEDNPPHQRTGEDTGSGSVGRSEGACFLCAFCTTDEVKCITSFICDNIANMDVGFMAQQIQDFVFEKRPELQGSRQAKLYGLEVVAIRKHIRLHMLSPTVRIADMMRHLLALCDTLRNNLYREDPDTGDVCADRANIDTYLKVVTQVLNMYKMAEPSKMLFANIEK